MEEGKECEGSECSGECDEDMSSGRSISRRDLGSPVVSRRQLIHIANRIQDRLPDGLMAIEVVCETPTEITKLSLVQFSSLNW